jgi:putative ABC transport system permease protein
MAGLDAAQAQSFSDLILDRVGALPGVENASTAIDLPLDLAAVSLGEIRPVDYAGAPSHGSERTEWNVVSPGFFQTIRLPLLRGRDFTKADRTGATAVAIINVTMAERFWPGENPIGKHVYRDQIEEGKSIEVVGLVREIPNRTFGEPPAPFIYVPAAQEYRSRQNLLVRTSNGITANAAIRDVIREMNPNLPVTTGRSLDDIIGLSLAPQRVAAWLVGVIGLVGLFLASLGIYGLTAHNVNTRVREIGIRVAIGAKPHRILGMMLREGLMISAVGIGIGFIGAIGAGYLVRSYLYNTGPIDLAAFSGATSFLAIAVLLGSYLPARRATQVDPVIALRHE